MVLKNLSSEITPPKMGERDETVVPRSRRRSVSYSSRRLILAVICVCGAGWTASAQTSGAPTPPDEHSGHHPEEKSAAPTTKKPAGIGTKPDPVKPDAMGDMGASAPPTAKPPGMGGKTAQSGGTGGGGGAGGGMGAMMDGMMGGVPPKELYPSLMALPAVTPEQRLRLQQQAEERVTTGEALFGQGAARMANPAASDLELQEGAADARTGLQEIESGRTARRALAEGQPPRAIGSQWFQTEMNLTSAMRPGERGIFHAITPFHLFTMVLLVLFALVMIALYFFKMRRAAALFGRLESKPGSPPPPPGEAAPLSGTPVPVDKKTPPDDKTPGGQAEATAAGAKVPPAVTGGDAANVAGKSSAPPDAGGTSNVSSPPPSVAVTEATSPPLMTANWRGQLRVGSIKAETPSVKTFRLLPPPGERFLPFTFLPGQFLNVAFSVGGARMNRSYSISSSPTEREHVDLSVRREPRGAVSRHFDDVVKVGDSIEIGGPVGKFTFDGTESDSIVLISGGVGITPMMSISRYLTERSWPGDIFFIYTCRTPADYIFAEEIAALQHLNPNLHVAVTVSKPEGTNWKGARGRITKEWLTQTVPDLASRRTHMCGPPAMMDAVKAIFAELGIPQDQLKSEAFGAAKPAPLAPGTAKATGPATGPLVTFSKNNKSSKVRLDLQSGDSPPRQTILELSEELSIGIEFSCRVGTCGVCKVKKTSGEVDMEVQDALDDDDKAQGIILACQAKPISDVTVEA